VRGRILLVDVKETNGQTCNGQAEAAAGRPRSEMEQALADRLRG
jgi:hypothetical protein